jgi:transglutaminase-like putative cysteine protease
MRHLGTILVVLLWLGLMGVLVQRERAAGGLDASTLSVPPVDPTAATDSVDWFGVYQQEKKIGHARRVERRTASGWTIEDESRLVLAMLGAPQTVTTSLYAETDAAYALRRFRFVLVSPAATFAASGQSDGTTLEVRYGPEGRSETITLPLAEPVYFANTLRPKLAAAWPEPGARFTHQVFSPTSMRREPMRVLVEGRETIDGVETLRIVEESQGLESRAWIDHGGHAVREQGALGFELRREPEEVARAGGDGAPVDLVATTHVPFTGTIADPRALDHLVLRVSGAAADHIPSAPPRQQVTGDVLRITREDPARMRGDETEDLAPYRAPSPFVESDDPAIVARARAIVGSATSAIDKVHRVLDWVAANVEREPSLTIPSARDVLRARRGDCNEHAVLVAALLRAAGVPARIVAGLAYANGGFYYHAWNEVWLDGWISVDAVFRQMPVDATHVKLLEGGPERHVLLAEVVGRLALTRIEEGT